MTSQPTLTTYPIEACDAIAWTFDAGSAVTRTSTAISVDGGCLLVDPVDGPGLDAALGALGDVVGVCTLLDRHRRDGAKIASRLGCPQLVPSTLAGSGEPLVIAGVQERAILAAPGWNESALWLPERRLLVCADSLGTTRYFLSTPEEVVGVHPLLRIRPPVGAFRGLEPVAIAVGHGAPVLEGATAGLQQAIATARSGLPRTWWRMLSSIARRQSH
jgi:hypothetical protein